MYEKQTWTRGETISSAKLNHMEEGIEKSMLCDGVVNAYYDTSAYTFTLKYGSFANLSAMVSNKECPLIVVKIWNETSNPAIKGSYFANSINAVSLDSDTEYITFNIDGQSSKLKWTSEDVVSFV